MLGMGKTPRLRRWITSKEGFEPCDPRLRCDACPSQQVKQERRKPVWAGGGAAVKGLGCMEHLILGDCRRGREVVLSQTGWAGAQTLSLLATLRWAFRDRIRRLAFVETEAAAFKGAHPENVSFTLKDKWSVMPWRHLGLPVLDDTTPLRCAECS